MKQVNNKQSKLGGIVLFSLAILCSAASCKRDCQDYTNPDCENYDPCYGKEKPSAKFIMEESNIVLRAQGIWIQDSVFWGTELRFRSELTENKFKHTWYVGTEKFNSHITPDRNFGNVARPQKITISHVIEYTPDIQCFPNDIGKDSIAQIFTLVASLNEEFQTYGTFRGALNGTSDTFDVKIVSLDKFNQPASFSTHENNIFINFHNRGDTIWSYPPNGTWPPHSIRGYFYNHEGFLTSPLQGSFHVNSDGTFEMSYENVNGWIDFLGDRELHIFKGRKID